MNELRQSRFNGLVEQVEFYLFTLAGGKQASKQQKEHLTELRNTICVFGELGEKYAELCDELLTA